MVQKRKPKFGRRRKSGARKSRARKRAFAWRILRVGFLAGIWVFVAVLILVAYYATELPDISHVTQWHRRPSITLLAADGSVFARYGDLYGDHVTFDEVPPYLPEAIVAIEDRRFYHHFGIDLEGMARAAVRDVLAGHIVEGGSTITQQLAKNLFLTPQRTFKRKIQEIMLALWLDHTYTKHQILTAYMNRVYLGDGTYGVDAAARTYFGKPVSQINLREAAILAGLLRAPSRFAPSRDPVEALERAHTVLDAMVECGTISKAQEKVALLSAPPPPPAAKLGGTGRYFADWVADQVEPLIENSPQDIVVSTTLDLRLQRDAEHDVVAALRAGTKHDVTQAALVTLAPDGAVRALVGGRDYHDSSSTARRKPRASRARPSSRSST